MIEIPLIICQFQHGDFGLVVIMGVFTFWGLLSCNATLFLVKEKGDLSVEIRVFENREGLSVNCVTNKQPKT